MKHQDPAPDSNKKRALIILGLTATCLLGLLAYKTFDDQLSVKFTRKNFIIPTDDPEKEQLKMELNHSLHKLNELKRLLFAHTKAPETVLVKELRASMADKEALLLEEKKLRFQSEIALQKEIEILKEDLNSLQKSLDKAYQHYTELSDRAEIGKFLDSLQTYYQGSKTAEKILSLAQAGAERDDELHVQQTLFALEKEDFLDKNRFDIEEIQKDLEEAVLQINLQQEREKLLESTLNHIKEQYNDLKSRLEKSEESVSTLTSIEKEPANSLLQLFMEELQVDQIQIQGLQYELEELAKALQAIEKERDSLRNTLDSKIEELAFEASHHETHIADLMQNLEEKREEQTAFTSKIDHLLQIYEEEKKNTHLLKEELEKTLEIQKLLEIQLLSQSQQLTDKEATLLYSTEKHLKEKSGLEMLLKQLEEKNYSYPPESEDLVYLKKLEVEIAEKEDLLEKNAQEKEEALKQHERECQALQDELIKEKNRFFHVSQDLEKASADFAKASQSIEDMKNELSEKEKLLLPAHGSRNGEIDSYREQLHEKEEIVKDLKKELEEAYAAKEKADRRASYLQDELEQQEVYLAKQLRADSESRKILEDELDELEQELSAARSFLTTTHRELETIHQDQEVNGRQIEELKRLLHEKEIDHQTQAESDQFAIKQLESEIQALKIAMENEEERAKHLEIELLSSQQKLENTEKMTQELKGQLRYTEEALQKTYEEKEVFSEKTIELNQALENREEQTKALQESLIEVNEKYQTLSFYLDEQKKSLSKLQDERDQLAEEVSYLNHSD